MHFTQLGKIRDSRMAEIKAVLVPFTADGGEFNEQKEKKICR